MLRNSQLSNDGQPLLLADMRVDNRPIAKGHQDAGTVREIGQHIAAALSKTNSLDSPDAKVEAQAAKLWSSLQEAETLQQQLMKMVQK